MYKEGLSFRQRIAASIAYASLLIAALWWLSGNPILIFTEGTSFNYVFVSAGLLLIFGVYIAEPYFAKPTDVLVNATAILLFLLSLPEEIDYLGKEILTFSYLILLALTVLLLFVREGSVLKQFSDLATRFLVLVGQSKVSFSIIYLATIITFFGDDQVAFFVLLTFWALFISAYWVEILIVFVSRRFQEFINTGEFIGNVVAIENKKVCIVEKTNTNVDIKVGNIVSFGKSESNIGCVVKKSVVIGAERLTVFMLDSEEAPILLPSTEVKKIDLATLNQVGRNRIMAQEVVSKSEKVIGYVHPDSDVLKIRFRIFDNGSSSKLTEGSIVSVKIRGKDVLYQIFDAATKDEKMSVDSSDTYFLAVARKLGSFNIETREIDNVKWLPEMFSPVYLLNNLEEPKTETDVGELPSTDYPIRVSNYDQLVTHNTAILGILGVGKSCLTFELVQKVVSNTSSKVVCFDITGEYDDQEKGLPRYVQSDAIAEKMFSIDELNALLEEKEIEAKDSKDDGGNVDLLKQYAISKFTDFLADECTSKVMVVNPEEIIAIQQADNAKNRQKNGQWEMYAPFAQLSIAEVTRVLSEAALEVCRSTGMQKESKLLLVYEEAHSLIPEWNSAANEGDRNAANGTARVILQGRKYGLGSFVVTQRTANISKTILNQCNTVFALKVFDDTGKQFLENYIGSDYASVLPTLDDRHAVITGKAFKLKQPVIVRLNDMQTVMLPKKEIDSSDTI